MDGNAFSDSLKARTKTGQVANNAILQYLADHSLRLHPAQDALIKETSRERSAMMMSSADEMQFFQNILRLMRATKVVEVGVYTGFGSLSMALALPPTGKLVALEVSSEYIDIGRPFWELAGVNDRIDVRIGPAIDSLNAMLANGEGNTFDFAFIDADKVNYCNYYELCVQLVRPGGIIAVDNILWDGKVVNNPNPSDVSTAAIQAVAKLIKNDNRVDVSMLPIADGVALCFKR